MAQFFHLPLTYHRGRARSTLSANFSALTLWQTNTKMHISMSLRLVATAITDTGSVNYVIYHNMKGQSLRVVSYDGKTAVTNVDRYCFLEKYIRNEKYIVELTSDMCNMCARYVNNRKTPWKEWPFKFNSTDSPPGRTCSAVNHLMRTPWC